MTVSEGDLRLAVVAAAGAMHTLGITRGTSGNVSARCRGGFIITPTRVPHDALAALDLVRVTPDAGSVPPHASSEWRLHAAIYGARSDVLAIVHAHPPFATALACLRRDIPAFHYLVALAGGADIRCADYATFGTGELADAAVRALTDRTACLLANHGMVACGRTPRAALDLAVQVEALAEQYTRALQAGSPVLLDRQEMARVRERMRGYGSAGD